MSRLVREQGDWTPEEGRSPDPMTSPERSDYLSLREQRRLVCACEHTLIRHTEYGCIDCGTSEANTPQHNFARKYATSPERSAVEHVGEHQLDVVVARLLGCPACDAVSVSNSGGATAIVLRDFHCAGCDGHDIT